MTLALKLNVESVTRCKIPPPSRALFEAMAKAGYHDNQARDIIRHPDGSPREPEPWEDQQEGFQEAMLSEARAMYAALAMFNGGYASVIEDPKL